MADISLNWSSDDRQVQKAFQRQQRQIAKLETALKKTSRSSVNLTKQQTNVASSAVGAATRMIATYASVNTAIRFVNASLQAQIDLHNKAEGVVVDTASAQIKFLRNLGDVSSEERSKALTTIREISKETGVKQSAIFLAASTAVSARGALSVQESLAAVRQAARIAPEDVGESTAIAGGILDVSTLTGIEDAKKNLGFLLAIGETARIVSPKDVSENVIRAALGVAATGDTPEFSTALVSTLTQAVKDPTGRISGTGAIQLARKLRDFLPEEDVFERDSRDRRVLKTKGTGLASTEARLRAVQESPDLTERFLALPGFEEKLKGAIERLIKKEDGLDKLLSETTVRIGDPKFGAEKAERIIAGIEAVPLQSAAAFSRGVSSSLDAFFADAVNLSDAAVARRTREKASEILEFNPLVRFLQVKSQDIRTGLGADALADVETTLGKDVAALERQPDSPAARRQIELLEQLVGLVRARQLNVATANPEAHAEPAGAGL